MPACELPTIPTVIKCQADFRAELGSLHEQFPSDGSLRSEVAYHLQLHQPGFNDRQVIEAIKRLVGFPDLPAARAYGAIAASYYRELPLPHNTSM